jgi:anti-sigma B factor antagonist
MKIKTEIINSIFIITCDGPSLDASLAQEFLSAMGGFIQKSQMDVLLDISGVNFVDSTGIGSVIRSLTEIDGHGQLILCGVNNRTLALLEMAHLDGTIHHEPTRDKALNSLFWDTKEDSHTTIVDETEFIDTTEEHEDINDLTTLLEPEKEQIPIVKKNQIEIPKEERRQYRRIEKKQIMDEEFAIFCKNVTTGRQYPGLVLNISPGGILMTTRSKLSIGDELLVEGRIGRQFKFKERAVSRSCRKQKHGLEFIDLSKETNNFLDRLTGSVDMIKSNRFHHDKPN